MDKNKDGHPIRYIGDGVYATYDGYGVWLKANGENNDRDKIYLEPDILAMLNIFYRDAITKIGGGK